MQRDTTNSQPLIQRRSQSVMPVRRTIIPGTARWVGPNILKNRYQSIYLPEYLRNKLVSVKCSLGTSIVYFEAYAPDINSANVHNYIATHVDHLDFTWGRIRQVEQTWGRITLGDGRIMFFPGSAIADPEDTVELGTGGWLRVGDWVQAGIANRSEHPRWQAHDNKEFAALVVMPRMVAAGGKAIGIVYKRINSNEFVMYSKPLGNVYLNVADIEQKSTTITYGMRIEFRAHTLGSYKYLHTGTLNQGLSCEYQAVECHVTNENFFCDQDPSGEKQKRHASSHHTKPTQLEAHRISSPAHDVPERLAKATENRQLIDAHPTLTHDTTSRKQTLPSSRSLQLAEPEEHGKEIENESSAQFHTPSPAKQLTTLDDNEETKCAASPTAATADTDVRFEVTFINALFSDPDIMQLILERYSHSLETLLADGQQ